MWHGQVWRNIVYNFVFHIFYFPTLFANKSENAVKKDSKPSEEFSISFTYIDFILCEKISNSESQSLSNNSGKLFYFIKYIRSFIKSRDIYI